MSSLKEKNNLVMPYDEIITVPDPRLSTPSETVASIDDEVRLCMDRLLKTIYSSGNGIAIAAVQVGVMKRIVVIDIDGVSNSPPSEQLHGGKPIYMANPEIISASEETTSISEGCLSVPQVRLEIPRHAEIKVKYLDYDGNERMEDVGGFLAICMQHEIDHTLGITMLDHVSPLKRSMQMKKVEKFKKLSALK